MVAESIRYNQSELSRVLNLNLATVKKWVAKPDAPKRDGAGKYSFEEFTRFYLAAKNTTSDQDEDKARKLAAEADLAEIKADEAKGVLINAEDAQRQFIMVATLVKSELLSQPPKIAPELLNLVKSGGEEAAICTYLTGVFKDVLRHLAKSPME